MFFFPIFILAFWLAELSWEYKRSKYEPIRPFFCIHNRLHTDMISHGKIFTSFQQVCNLIYLRNMLSNWIVTTKKLFWLMRWMIMFALFFYFHVFQKINNLSDLKNWVVSWVVLTGQTGWPMKIWISARNENSGEVWNNLLKIMLKIIKGYINEVCWEINPSGQVRNNLFQFDTYFT